MAGYKRPRPTPADFIEAWQTSEAVVEVAKRLRMSTAQVRVRACRYRKRGVPLKEYEWPGPPDWEYLAEYAKEVLAEYESEEDEDEDESEDDDAGDDVPENDGAHGPPDGATVVAGPDVVRGAVNEAEMKR